MLKIFWYVPTEAILVGHGCILPKTNPDHVNRSPTVMIVESITQFLIIITKFSLPITTAMQCLADRSFEEQQIKYLD